MRRELPGRLKILVSAYACSPYRGSEPGMGWGFVSRIAQNHELWVITEKLEFEPDIERKKAEHPELFESLRFHYVPRRHHELIRRLWPPSYYWFYRRWQKQAYRVASRLRREVDFDLIHQLNIVGFREPGYLWKMLDLPFVWGPIGGLDNTPWRMLPTLGWHGAAYYGARNIINVFQQRFSQRPCLAARRPAAALLSATPSTRQRALEIWGAESLVMCEVGTPTLLAPPRPRARGSAEPLRIVWSGTHTSGKALNILLEALPRLRGRVDYELEILGHGRETARWQKLAQRLGVWQRCRWHGWVPRDRALEIMGNGHVLCITSLYDLTSTVTLEALATGLPIVCLDLFGFREAITPECGFKIPVTTPADVRQALADRIAHLYEHEDERQRLCQGAIRRSKDFEWDKRMDHLNNIYAELVGRKR